jgi:hypothetical protein
VRIGPFQIRAREDDRPAVLENPLRAHSLWDVPLPQVTLTFPRSSGELSCRLIRVLTLVGRDRRCRLRLSYPSVSRFDSSLVHTPGGLWVVNLFGRGELAVNGRRVRASRLEDGDELRIGSVEARVRIEGAYAEGPPGEPTPLAEGGNHQAGAPLVSLPVWVPATGALTTEMDSRTFDPPQSASIATLSDDQFGDLQRQMLDQFQQTMLMMAGVFATLHRDQMAQVHEELERLRQINQDLSSLRAELATRSAAGATPSGDPVMDATLARIDDLLSALQPHANPSLEVNRQALAATSGSVSLPAPSPPSPGKGRTRTNKKVDRATAGPAQSARQAALTAPPDGREGDASPPEDQPGGHIHALLCQKIAALQQERQGRWQRVLDLVRGS